MENFKVTEELAVSEMQALVKKFTKKTVEPEEITKQYPNVIEAIRTGNMILDAEGGPTLTLADPVLNSQGDVSLSAVNFKTRILPSEQRKISKGIDVSKDTLLFAHRCISFIIDQEVAMLDKFSKEDYTTVEQLASLFI